jgi:hypothetical protein
MDRCGVGFGIMSRLAAALIGALLALWIWRTPTQAAERRYVVAAPEGYGLDECIKTSAACQKVAADAWCASHGDSRAVAFGLSDDVTAAISHVPRPSAIPSSLLVTCRD